MAQIVRLLSLLLPRWGQLFRQPPTLSPFSPIHFSSKICQICVFIYTQQYYKVNVSYISDTGQLHWTPPVIEIIPWKPSCVNKDLRKFSTQVLRSIQLRIFSSRFMAVIFRIFLGEYSQELSWGFFWDSQSFTVADPDWWIWIKPAL